MCGTSGISAGLEDGSYGTKVHQDTCAVGCIMIAFNASHWCSTDCSQMEDGPADEGAMQCEDVRDDED